jgi:hypothetical protein
MLTKQSLKLIKTKNQSLRAWGYARGNALCEPGARGRAGATPGDHTTEGRGRAPGATHTGAGTAARRELGEPRRRAGGGGHVRGRPRGHAPGATGPRHRGQGAAPPGDGTAAPGGVRGRAREGPRGSTPGAPGARARGGEEGSERGERRGGRAGERERKGEGSSPWGSKSGDNRHRST